MVKSGEALGLEMVFENGYDPPARVLETSPSPGLVPGVRRFPDGHAWPGQAGQTLGEGGPPGGGTPPLHSYLTRENGFSHFEKKGT